MRTTQFSWQSFCQTTPEEMAKFFLPFAELAEKLEKLIENISYNDSLIPIWELNLVDADPNGILLRATLFFAIKPSNEFSKPKTQILTGIEIVINHAKEKIYEYVNSLSQKKETNSPETCIISIYPNFKNFIEHLLSIHLETTKNQKKSIPLFNP